MAEAANSSNGHTKAAAKKPHPRECLPPKYNVDYPSTSFTENANLLPETQREKMSQLSHYIRLKPWHHSKHTIADCSSSKQGFHVGFRCWSDSTF